MRKQRFFSLIIVLVFTFSIFGIGKLRAIHAENNRINVVATLEAFAGIVKAIGGDYVNVDFIVPDGVSPHEYSLTRQDEEKIANADLVVLSNSRFLSLEEKIKEKFPDKVYLDFSDYQNCGVTILPAPGIEKNYHGYWLYPKNAIAISKVILAKISILDPQHAEYFEGNERVLEEKIRNFEEKMIDKAKDLNIFGKGALLAVPGVAYIAYSFGLEPKKSLLKAPGAFVGASEINEIVEMIKKGEIVIGFCPESLRDAKPGELMRDIQSQAFFPIAYVRVFSLGGVDDYIALLAYNYAVVSNINYSGKSTTGSSEITLYLAVGFIVVTIIALIEALMILNYMRSVREILYE